MANDYSPLTFYERFQLTKRKLKKKTRVKAHDRQIHYRRKPQQRKNEIIHAMSSFFKLCEGDGITAQDKKHAEQLVLLMDDFGLLENISIVAKPRKGQRQRQLQLVQSA